MSSANAQPLASDRATSPRGVAPRRTAEPTTASPSHPWTPNPIVAALTPSGQTDWQRTWVTVDRGGIRWRVEPTRLPELLGPSGLRWEEWRRSGAERLVKRAEERSVHRVALPGGAVYIKQFHPNGWRARVRQWMRRGKGVNEVIRAGWLKSVGIPTIQPVALGERRRFGLVLDNWVVSEELIDTMPLDRFLETELPTLAPVQRAALSRAVVEELANLTARLHHHQFVHHDLHPGNLLIQWSWELDRGETSLRKEPPRPRVKLTLIDLDALRRRSGPLPNWMIEWNLAVLDHYFRHRYPAAPRLRFVTLYLRTRQRLRAEAQEAGHSVPTTSTVFGGHGEPLDPRSLASAVSTRTRAWAERLWTRWSRRCLSVNKYFQAIRFERDGRLVKGFVARDFDSEALRAILSRSSAWFAASGSIEGVEPIKVSSSARILAVDSRAWRCQTSGNHPETTDDLPSSSKRIAAAASDCRYLIKRHECGPWWRRWTTLVRSSPARRAWQAAQHARVRGVPTPRHWAWIVETDFLGLPIREDLVMEDLRPARRLDHVSRKRWVGLSEPQRRRAARATLERVARLIALMHERSLTHHDLKLSNLLVLYDDEEAREPTGSADEPREVDPTAGPREIWLIDLAAMSHRHPLGEKAIIQDLTRLEVSRRALGWLARTDALRFLQIALAGGLSDRDRWKRIWRRIDAASQAKLERNRRRGRPIS